MKISLLIALLLTIMNINFGQNTKTLVADGTMAVPKKYDLQPTIEKLSAKEIEAVKKAALEKEVEFDEDHKQMSSEESNFKKDFELLDVAEGFFIYREIEFRSYLYTAYSQTMKRNYQGIIVLSITDNGTKFAPKAHYIYEYRGDKYIRQLADINGNILSELAIFSEPPTKKNYRRYVRIIEFSPDGLVKIGSKEIYSSIPQKQRMPYSSDKNKPAKRVYSPPIVKAIKLYTVKSLGKSTEFYEETWREQNDNWAIMDELELLLSGMDEDKINYIEIIKPAFPKQLGER